MTQYISKYLNLKLIIKSAYRKEVDGTEMVVTGSAIQFEKGIYATDNKTEINFLDNHPNCGNVFIKVPAKTDPKKARRDFTETLEERNKKAKQKKKTKKEKAMAAAGQGEEEEEESEEGEQVGLEGLTIKELKKMAREKEVDIKGLRKKPDIIKAIEAAEEEEEEAPANEEGEETEEEKKKKKEKKENKGKPSTSGIRSTKQTKGKEEAEF